MQRVLFLRRKEEKDMSYFQLRNPGPGCPVEEACLRWVEVYLGDCVCSVRDGASFLLGIVSVVSWTVAEVPQIVTNFKNGSTEGVSLMFLFTWFIGDLFNLAGCWLEPATLPTQFYMALMYTLTTLVLLFQSIYYDHLWKWSSARIKGVFSKNVLTKDMDKSSKSDNETEILHVKNELSHPLKVTNESLGLDGVAPRHSGNRLLATSPISYEDETPGKLPQRRASSTSPVPIIYSDNTRSKSVEREHYYMSARSLGNSYTATVGSYTHSESPFQSRFQGNSSRKVVQKNFEDEPKASNSLQAKLLSGDSKTLTKSKSLRCLAVPILFLGCVQVFLRYRSIPSIPEGEGIILNTGRRILQINSRFTENMVLSNSISTQIGSCLGWLMAAIYMGGRIPQIYLNIKRGSAEGLNPLMFIFALVGNATYVGSILARSLQWARLQPNLPWLIDALGCMILDCFIVVQSFNLRRRRAKLIVEELNGSYDAV